MPALTRRRALCQLASVGAAFAWSRLAAARPNVIAQQGVQPADLTPPLIPGAPASPQRMAFIDAFLKDSEGLEKPFEARTHKSDWTMPYRLFRPATTAKLPLVLYLHGSGGLGDDNLKQLEFGNIFGTRVWLLPENRKNFPCYVVVPQTDRGWARYDLTHTGSGPTPVIPGLGDGSRLALEVVDKLCREFPVDTKRIYVLGQSMGGAGVWNITAHRKQFFAAAAICCGSETAENATESIGTPLWCFHGDADQTVPVTVSRDRIAALRKAGAHPLYTEYAGVDHEVWQWAFTEPSLIQWIFSQRRS
jgi:predicted peptidase